MRVLVAMSGGVDSSVASARLVADGHEVIGVTLHLWDYPGDEAVRGRCCAPEDVRDAARVADVLGIAHYAFDRRRDFDREIVSPFVGEYLAGTTPSPCVACNRRIKLKELLRLRVRLGADVVATGHFARIRTVDGHPHLLRARDRQKDQSYFLHTVDPETLAVLRFPLGELTKSEVRAAARELGLPGAEKGESQELCFVPKGRYVDLVEARAGSQARPGPIVDRAGRELGRHRGVHGFTLGQRHHLGVALGVPTYVTGLDPVTGRVEVGPRDHLRSSGAILSEIVLGHDVALPMTAEVAIRYRAEPVRARVEQGPTGRALVHFEGPVFAVVPGQYAVFYAGDRVLGGGRIEAWL
ncbi:MAG: tRNA 2-thiouridine(34) synthase MnmA [Polyangiaceae bacterium]|nr:tRNA 2-thiouridine(34) synthase MnmA [Polyangiaceae bacterium]